MSEGRYHTSKMILAAVSAAGVGIGYMIGCGYWRKKNITETVLDFEELYIPKELRNSKYSKELRLAIELALEAGKKMQVHLESKGTTEQKTLECSTKSNVTDFATEIDVQNEAFIIAGIRQHFPSHEIIGEEMVGDDKSIPPPSKTTNTWIIDPVDGTTNFAHGLPLTCVSIGMTDKTGRPVMGCVYAPATNELFLAVKDCGAYRNGRRIFAQTQDAQPLSSAIVVFEFGYVFSDAEAIDKLVHVFQAILKQGIQASRGLGSGVLNLCYVACGKIDAVYCGIANEAWKPWDYCAGALMVEEAKACITTLFDDQDSSSTPPFDLYAKSMIAGTSTTIVQQLKKVIREASPTIK